VRKAFNSSGSIVFVVLRCFSLGRQHGVAVRFPHLAPAGLKSHVHNTKKDVIRSFHDIFVLLQCFAKHPLSLQVATPHFTHPNLVLRLFWASLLLQLLEISPKTTLFRFLTGRSVQTEQYRCGSPDASSWCCNAGSGLVFNICVCFGGSRTLLSSSAFCKSTRNRRTY
jgi:hypothetical protein